MAFNLGTAQGDIRLSYSGRAAAAAAIRDVGLVEKRSTGATGALGKLSKAAGLAFGAAVVGGLAVAVKSAASFEKQISAINAVSGATPGQLEKVRQKALQLGADTAFSATESGLAMEELIKAGLTVDQVLNGAADATVALAAAGGVELPEAATIASNAMNQFNLNAQDMTSVVDDIAGAANTSAVDVGELGQSLQQVGAVANLAGLSFEDTATAIGLMGDAGIRGSDAGTSLKTMLQNLQPTTEKQTALFKELGLITKDGTNAFFDAQGNVKSLADLSGVLSKALQGQTKQQKLATLETLFGTDAIRAAAIIADEGSKGVTDFAESMNKVSAADVAAKRLDNFEGSVEQLKGSLETLLITIGTPLLAPLRELVDLATDGANALADFADGSREPPEPLRQLMKVADNVWQTLVNMYEALTDSSGGMSDLAHVGGTALIGALRIISELVLAVSEAFDGQGSILLIAAAAWLTLGGRITTAATAMKTASVQAVATAGALRTASTRMALLSSAARNAAGVGGMAALMVASQDTNAAVSTLGYTAAGVGTGFAVGGPWGAAIGGAAGLLYGLGDAFLWGSDSAEEAADGVSEFNNAIAESKRIQEEAEVASLEWLDTINKQTGAFTRATRQLARYKFQEQGVLGLTESLGIETRDLIDGALTPGNREWGKLTDRLQRAVAQGKLTRSEFDRIMGVLVAVRGSAGEAAGRFDRLNGNIRKVPRNWSTTYKTEGVDEGWGQFQELADIINSIPRHKKVTITQETDTSLEDLLLPDRRAYGGIDTYANGAIRAGVYGNSKIKFAEAGTEAYIPFRKDRRRRAEKILAMVAESFGGQFIKMAEGNVIGLQQSDVAQLSAPTVQVNTVAPNVRRTDPPRPPTTIIINNPEAERSSASLQHALTTLAHTGKI